VLQTAVLRRYNAAHSKRRLSMQEAIPEELRRFVLASFPTVPHVEILLLLWREPVLPWSVRDIARRVFVPELRAAEIAEELSRDGLLVGSGDPRRYSCRREPAHVAALIDELERAYSRRVREIATLIHEHGGPVPRSPRQVAGKPS
jgi:hypothetical protein